MRCGRQMSKGAGEWEEEMDNLIEGQNRNQEDPSCSTSLATRDGELLGWSGFHIVFYCSKQKTKKPKFSLLTFHVLIVVECTICEPLMIVHRPLPKCHLYRHIPSVFKRLASRLSEILPCTLQVDGKQTTGTRSHFI